MKQVQGISDVDEVSPLLNEKNKRKTGIINAGTSTPEVRKGSG